MLLSSKAGGTGEEVASKVECLHILHFACFCTGLNLIGASRILLYDMDWNPANDVQGESKNAFAVPKLGKEYFTVD